MSAQTVFGIQDLRQEILLLKTQAELVDRKKIENERIAKCLLIYPSWVVTHRACCSLPSKTILSPPDLLMPYRQTIVHNHTALVYPVSREWWSQKLNRSFMIRQ